MTIERPFRSSPGVRAAVAAAAVSAIVLMGATSAEAYDDHPCQAPASGTQICPLTSLLTGNRVPVYANPVPRANGAAVPSARSGRTAAAQQLEFICQQDFGDGGLYWHPNNRWYNDWWALTRGDDGRLGWVPEVFFNGGDNLEPDLGLTTTCPGAAPPPPPPPAAAPCQPTPETAQAKLRATFNHSRRTATRSYGHKPRVRGKLTTAAGAPMAGAKICVGVQRRADQPVAATATITTSPRGRFSYRIGVGASRRLCFVHRLGSGAASACVDLHVRAPVSMRASRRVLSNGQSTVFHGRVRGPRARGLLVELQYPQRGTWQPFHNARVGPKGRFRYRYTFTRTFGTRTYRLRARVRSQRGYPYVAGWSSTVRVRVSG